MPTIRVTIPQKVWSVEEKSKMVTDLTASLNAIAQGGGKGDITQYISVHVEETAVGGYGLGGSVIA